MVGVEVAPGVVEVIGWLFFVCVHQDETAYLVVVAIIPSAIRVQSPCDDAHRRD
jgi:hypothetical protein